MTYSLVFGFSEQSELSQFDSVEITAFPDVGYRAVNSFNDISYPLRYVKNTLNSKGSQNFSRVNMRQFNNDPNYRLDITPPFRLL